MIIGGRWIGYDNLSKFNIYIFKSDLLKAGRFFLLWANYGLS